MNFLRSEENIWKTNEQKGSCTKNDYCKKQKNVLYRFTVLRRTEKKNIIGLEILRWEFIQEKKKVK